MKAFLKKRYSVTVMNTVREERLISAYRLQFNTVGSQGKTLLTGLLPATCVQLAFLYNPGPPPGSKEDSAHSRRLSSNHRRAISQTEVPFLSVAR